MTVKLYQVADITETGAYKAKDAYTTLGVDKVNSETKTEEWTAMAATAAELAAGMTEDYRAVKAKDSDSVKLELPMELGLYLVLVDDVVTTGSTLTECARLLRKCGAERVYAVAFCRTQRKLNMEKQHSSSE